MIGNHLVIWVVLFPLFCSIANIYIYKIYRSHKSAPFFYRLVPLSNFLISIYFKMIRIDASYFFANFKPPLGIELMADHLSVNFYLIVSFFILFSSILLDKKYSSNYIISSIFLMMITGINGIIFSNDIFNIYIFWEIIYFCFYKLIMNDKKNNFNVCFYYLLNTSVASCLYLLAVNCFYIDSGSLSMKIIASNFNLNAINSLGVVFFTIAMLLKVGSLPINGWIINSYKKFSTPFFIFSSSVLTNVNLYILTKFYYNIFIKAYMMIEYILVPLAIILLLLGLIKAFVANTKDNIKDVMIYSSSYYNSQIISYIFIMIKFPGFIPSLATQIVSAGLCKFFLLVKFNYRNILIKRKLDNNVDMIDVATVVSIINLIGLPITIGFVAKIALFKVIFTFSRLPMMIALVIYTISGTVSINYSINILRFYIFHYNGKLFHNNVINLEKDFDIYYSILFFLIKVISIFTFIFPISNTIFS